MIAIKEVKLFVKFSNECSKLRCQVRNAALCPPLASHSYPLVSHSYPDTFVMPPNRLPFKSERSKSFAWYGVDAGIRKFQVESLDSKLSTRKPAVSKLSRVWDVLRLLRPFQNCNFPTLQVLLHERLNHSGNIAAIKIFLNCNQFGHSLSVFYQFEI